MTERPLCGQEGANVELTGSGQVHRPESSEQSERG
jgi:hypothetical protein